MPDFFANVTPTRFRVEAVRNRYSVGVRQAFTRAVAVRVGDRTTTVRQGPQFRIGVQRQLTRVVSVGTQGPRGAPGEGWVEVPFRFGDATPKPLVTVAAGVLVKAVRLFVTEAFDGAGAALSVGDAGDPERLMASAEVLPGFVGEYETAPAVSYVVPTQVLLYITPGAVASAGGGVVVIEA